MGFFFPRTSEKTGSFLAVLERRGGFPSLFTPPCLKKLQAALSPRPAGNSGGPSCPGRILQFRPPLFFICTFPLSPFWEPVFTGPLTHERNWSIVVPLFTIVATVNVEARVCDTHTARPPPRRRAFFSMADLTTPLSGSFFYGENLGPIVLLQALLHARPVFSFSLIILYDSCCGKGHLLPPAHRCTHQIPPPLWLHSNYTFFVFGVASRRFETFSICSTTLEGSCMGYPNSRIFPTS